MTTSQSSGTAPHLKFYSETTLPMDSISLKSGDQIFRFEIQINQMVIRAPPKKYEAHDYYMKWSRGKYYKGKFSHVPCPLSGAFPLGEAKVLHHNVSLSAIEKHEVVFDVILHLHNDLTKDVATEHFEKKDLEIDFVMFRFTDSSKKEQKSRTNLESTKVDLRSLMQNAVAAPGGLRAQSSYRIPITETEYAECSIQITPIELARAQVDAEGGFQGLLHLEAKDCPATFIENCEHRYRINTLKEFQKMRDFATRKEGWVLQYEAPNVVVESRTPDPIPNEAPTGINIFRVMCEYPNVQASHCFDALNDAEFRKSWDEKMLEGYNICQLDSRNDIGYYAVKCPWPISTRDFCNLRSWMEFTNGEYLIMNHSVPHPECPERKEYVRALSKLSGYYMVPNPKTGGMTMIFVTYSDMKMSLPAWLLNYGTKSVAPDTLQNLEKKVEKYEEWVKEKYPADYVPHWRTPKVDWDGNGEEQLLTSSPSVSPTISQKSQSTTSMVSAADLSTKSEQQEAP